MSKQSAAVSAEVQAKIAAEEKELAEMLAAEESAKVGTQVEEFVQAALAQDENDRLVALVGISFKVTGRANDTLKEKAKLKGWPVSHYVLSLVYADTGDTMPPLAKKGRASIYVHADGTPMTPAEKAKAKADEKAKGAAALAAEKAIADSNAAALAKLRAEAKSMLLTGNDAVIDVAAMREQIAKLHAMLLAE